MSQEDNLRKLYEKMSRRQLCDAMSLTLHEMKRISEKFSMQLIEQAKKTSGPDAWKDPYKPNKGKPMTNLFHKTSLFEKALAKVAAEEPEELPEDIQIPSVFLLPGDSVIKPAVDSSIFEIDKLRPMIKGMTPAPGPKAMPAKPKKPKKPKKPGGPGRKLYPKKPGKNKPNRRSNTSPLLASEASEKWQVMSRPHSNPDQHTVIAEFNDYSDASKELGRQLKKYCPSVLEQRFVTGEQKWKVPKFFLWMQKKRDD